MTERLCMNCEFWGSPFVVDMGDNDQREVSGCHKYAPRHRTRAIVSVKISDDFEDRDLPFGEFPVTSSGEWCGEFQVKPREQGGKDDPHSQT